MMPPRTQPAIKPQLSSPTCLSRTWRSQSMYAGQATETNASSELKCRRPRNRMARITPQQMSSSRRASGEAASSSGITPKARTTARADSQGMASMLSSCGGGDNAAAGAGRVGDTLSGRYLEAAGNPHLVRAAPRLPAPGPQGSRGEAQRRRSRC